MADKFTPEKRSVIMSHVKGQDTQPEKLVRSLLHEMGYRFRLHRRDLPGNPDIVLPKHRKIIFVHGCFWHDHKNCPRATRPTTRADFWDAKIGGNASRDRRVVRRLRSMGWSVMVIWQCQTRDKAKLERRIERFMQSRK